LKESGTYASAEEPWGVACCDLVHFRIAQATHLPRDFDVRWSRHLREGPLIRSLIGR